MDKNGLEYNANNNILRYLRITIFSFVIVWLFCVVEIFNVDDILMGVSLLICSLIMIIPMIICHYMDMHKAWVKYMILFFVIVAISFINSVLTYHTVLSFVLPLFFATQYGNKKIIYYTYILTVIGLSISVMVGYYYGICDANMLILTNDSYSHYINDTLNTILPISINFNPLITLSLYFILPRSMILLVLIPIMQDIISTISSNAIHIEKLKLENEIDKPTRFYNKHKFNEMINQYYPTISQVGVIFWDVNNLKTINDKYGHSYGDLLISNISSSIYELGNNNRKIYRIGGDEFVMILENPGSFEIADIIEIWNEKLIEQNQISKFPLSASIGFSQGNGKDIKCLIKHADKMMYEDKKQFHSSN
jgi:hypothetical protein